MTAIVLDASVALAWCIERPTPPYADRIAKFLLGGGRAVVPGLWHLEVANGLIKGERRRLLSPADVVEAVKYLDVVLARSVDVSSDSVSISGVLSVARTFSLTAYDALYLQIAIRQELRLASLDKALLSAALKAGVEIVQ